ncbi:mucin-binding protein [Lactobacillus sp. PV034]|uniref:mucin-binding protein n=1 Tax=Lactobacillus sp. PV034 TaxID=2594495 RepID=UPI00223FAD3C|nr:MucBP domain-containing protein [Lactobacillus sp. PV034]QNQ81425.1 YSIRK-type signal peptide-containing protein [Lactobacillus sp. PV034]
MVSKNNRIKKMEQAAQRNNHFSIRKLTIGAASVLLGTSLYLGTQTSQAHAAEVAKADEKVEVVNNKSSEAEPVSASPSQADKKADVTTNKDQIGVAVDSLTKDSVETNQAAKQKTSAENKDTKEEKTAKLDSQIVNSKKVVTTTNDDKNKTYHIKVTAWDDATNAPLTRVYGDAAWNFNFENGVLDVEKKNSDFVYDLGTAPRGYKLMNPDAVTDNFKLEGNNAYPNGHDVDITLHYAPLSPVYVEYVDESGKVLSFTRAFSNYFSSQSIANAEGNPIYPGTSQYLAHAIDIPGYELVSAPEYVGSYDKVQSAGNENPIIVQFKYKKVSPNEDPKDIKSGATLNQQWIAPSVEYLPGEIEIKGQQGKTYGEANGDIEKEYQDLINRYNKQGYSWLGTFNYVKNDEYYNINAPDSMVYLIPNKPVTAYYVDQNGQQIADATTIEKNEANPDQTNNGINYSDHWHAAGDWKLTAKDIDGYVLDKTYGATEGKFTPYPYTVTFVYTKKEEKVPDLPPVIDNEEVAGEVLYIDDTTNTTLDSVDLHGEVGQKINYSTEASIKDYEDKGYDFVSSNFKNNDEVFSNGSNVFEVHFKHGTEPVNPNHPGAGYTSTELQHNVTRIITYVGAGDKTPGAVTQTVKFAAQGTMDKVTGKLVTLDKAGNIVNEDGKLTWTPDSANLNAVTTPVVTNYHVVSVSADSKDGINVDSITVNHNSADSNVIVKYAKNEGKVPGNAPTVTDPEAVIGQVAYIDDTTGKTLSKATIAGEVGQKIDYNTTSTIEKYEDEGYDFVSSNFDNGNETFAKTGNDFEVHFKHGTEPVNPNHPGKPGEPLNPNDPEAKFPDGTAKTDLEKTVTRTITYVANGEAEDHKFVAPKTVTQNIKFTASGIIDKVTGNLVTVDAAGNITSQDGELTWTPESTTLNGVKTPVVNYYHVISVSADSKDGVNVDTVTVDHDSANIDVVVTYAPNGHIVPVDPNGNPIPNVPVDTPPYPSDPTDPSKVVPNVPIPDIPGYVPEKPTKDGEVPTPPNPSDNIKVPYIKKETSTMPPLVDTKPEAAVDVIKYINDTTGETMSEVKVAGEVGSEVTYSTTSTISNYEEKGYKFVSSNFENGKEVFVKGGQTFEVHFTQGTEPVEPNTPTDPNPTPQPHPQPTPDVEIPDEPTPEDPSIDVPMPHPQTPEVPEEPEDNTPAPHASVPEEPVSVKKVPVVHVNEVQENEDVPMPHATQEVLPQTGEKTSAVGIIAGAIASVLGIIGLASRRKEDK